MRSSSTPMQTSTFIMNIWWNEFLWRSRSRPSSSFTFQVDPGKDGSSWRMRMALLSAAGCRVQNTVNLWNLASCLEGRNTRVGTYLWYAWTGTMYHTCPHVHTHILLLFLLWLDILQRKDTFHLIWLPSLLIPINHLMYGADCPAHLKLLLFCYCHYLRYEVCMFPGSDTLTKLFPSVLGDIFFFFSLE